jgi:hypothetical protein
MLCRMSDPHPTRQSDPIVVSTPEPVPEPVPTAYNIQQVTQTQVNTAIPAHVWTTQALMDLHAKQKDVNDNNVRSIDDERKREHERITTQNSRMHQLNIAGFVLVGAIVVFGLYLVAVGNPFGKDIIGATVLFLSGFLAGKGSK